MKRTPLATLDLAGEACEVAFALGRARAVGIARAIEFWEESLAETFRGQRGEIRRLEKAFLSAAQGSPLSEGKAYLEEICAMAEGAGVPFSDLFRLNLTELRSYVEKCTTLVLPVATPGGRRILLAHNEDWDPKRNDVFLLRVRLPEVSYLVVAYDGYLPGLSTGYNSRGLHHAINYLAEPRPRIGLPRIFVTRYLVTASCIDECVGWIRKTRRAFSQSIHLAEGDRYLGIELTARGMALRRPSLPAAHTNHFLSRIAGRISPSDSSRERLAAARRLLRDARRTPSYAKARALARKVLSDRSGFPYAIWREADAPEDPAASLAMALHGTHSLSCEVYRKRPDRNPPRRLELRKLI